MKLGTPIISVDTPQFPIVGHEFFPSFLLLFKNTVITSLCRHFCLISDYFLRINSGSGIAGSKGMDVFKALIHTSKLPSRKVGPVYQVSQIPLGCLRIPLPTFHPLQYWALSFSLFFAILVAKIMVSHLISLLSA